MRFRDYSISYWIRTSGVVFASPELDSIPNILVFGAFGHFWVLLLPWIGKSEIFHILAAKIQVVRCPLSLPIQIAKTRPLFLHLLLLIKNHGNPKYKSRPRIVGLAPGRCCQSHRQARIVRSFQIHRHLSQQWPHSIRYQPDSKSFTA